MKLGSNYPNPLVTAIAVSILMGSTSPAAAAGDMQLCNCRWTCEPETDNLLDVAEGFGRSLLRRTSATSDRRLLEEDECIETTFGCGFLFLQSCTGYDEDDSTTDSQHHVPCCTTPPCGCHPMNSD
mmetsp:Transcript_6/g.16  ORF Transcript_6/g.16 Transcript_6/m.16 type:complete len:126 (+) Transcript_6:557-934(+)|eukprot:CAMPEP_0183730260 /NCGR_PEP_ID=MMETSP0737-20130205/32387_1 /TAXON_ID=385413 /ORGANISM="Thalassiosira miniscula, Strain CCMP1093" /LENGTH=125 /DNA_ID=CAMNT_0025962707 /DNA_START=545 /DNA_END=922 /DNA_ORIENTATION=-